MHLLKDEADIIETEYVEVMLGLVALPGGVLSRDLSGLRSASGWRQYNDLLCFIVEAFRVAEDREVLELMFASS